MTTRVDIGRKVCTERKRLRYTQKQISELSGINKTTISEIENGRFTGSFDIFERVLNAVSLQFDVVPQSVVLPDWNDIDKLFSED
ncbi:helix-turn-helix transcriptional regulator [Acinetobacter sp. B10A]|uniref:helix-turn-helix domain-containing protein n=1 Tax=Acinetobacter baretiae TaxID=2605383 RepID=UPI001B3C5D29|nr:helix-turn-helix transcriptional regulator [Acinetobacter baretiae]MBF7686552.1 helix-turn-helix transcriptional regulator [Acinetobacter baretiae]